MLYNNGMKQETQDEGGRLIAALLAAKTVAYAKRHGLLVSIDYSPDSGEVFERYSKPPSTEIEKLFSIETPEGAVLYVETTGYAFPSEDRAREALLSIMAHRYESGSVELSNSGAFESLISTIAMRTNKPMFPGRVEGHLRESLVALWNLEGHVEALCRELCCNLIEPRDFERAVREVAERHEIAENVQEAEWAEVLVRLLPLLSPRSDLGEDARGGR